ncbi:MAG: uracil-DNA glycosylase [Actinomycetota bacterium]
MAMSTPASTETEVVSESLEAISEQVVGCHRCARLVAWREAVALKPPARFRGQTYWARPLPGFGDPRARLLVVGLAPAAHGGNRTGRIFTGDLSGDWLFRALYRAGFASQATSRHLGDGLALSDCYIAAVVRCVPPQNKPLPAERDACLPYLAREITALENLQVIVALGAFAWEGSLRALRLLGHPILSPKPSFAHGAVAPVASYRLVGSYHPSQRNTQTGTLGEQALDAVFERARSLLSGS